MIADATIVYMNLGISKGMQYGIDHAKTHGKPIEYRALPDGWDDDWSDGIDHFDTSRWGR